jgi:hypothetical protein
MILDNPDHLISSLSHVSAQREREREREGTDDPVKIILLTTAAKEKGNKKTPLQQHQSLVEGIPSTANEQPSGSQKRCLLYTDMDMPLHRRQRQAGQAGHFLRAPP